MDLPSVSPSPQMVGAALAASGVNVRLIDLTTGADLLAFPSARAVARAKRWCLARTEAAPLIAAGSEVVVWDLEARRPLFTMHHDRPVARATISPDGSQIVTASGNVALIRDGATGDVLASLTHPDQVNQVAYRLDGRQILVAWGGFGRVIGGAWGWDVVNHYEPRVQLPHGDDVLSAAYSVDSQRILTASFDRTARLWNAADGTPLVDQILHPLPVRHAAFSPDNRRILTVDGHEVRVRSASGEVVVLRHQGTVHVAAFSHDGGRVVTGGADHLAASAGAATGEPVIPPLVHSGPVLDAAFSPDGQYVVTGSADKTARVWDLAVGLRPSLILRHGAYAETASFDSTGSRILSFGRAGDLRNVGHGSWTAGRAANAARSLSETRCVLSRRPAHRRSRRRSHCTDLGLRYIVSDRDDSENGFRSRSSGFRPLGLEAAHGWRGGSPSMEMGHARQYPADVSARFRRRGASWRIQPRRPPRRYGR